MSNKEPFVLPPLSVSEASNRLGKSPGWIWERIKTGQIKHINKGRNVYISVEEINRINTDGCE
jgi:DNA-binding Lrp family transcriptional regulator